MAEHKTLNNEIKINSNFKYLKTTTQITHHKSLILFQYYKLSNENKYTMTKFQSKNNINHQRREQHTTKKLTY